MPDADWIEKLVTSTGPMAVIFGLFVWFLKTYGARFFEKHIALTDTLETTQKTLQENSVQLTANVNKLTDSVINQQKELGHCKTTSSALIGLCDTFEHAAQGHAKEPQIKSSLQNVRTILINGK